MKHKITLFVLDDNIYKSPDFIESSVYNSKISQGLLLELASKYNWTGHKHLQNLLIEILNSPHTESGSIVTYGFQHPSLCLDEIDNGLLPDFVIYDWEYGSESEEMSSEWLKDILDSTDAFVFIYSSFRDSIPKFLKKNGFDKYSYKFQLFKKGENTDNIFSSEEFIEQCIYNKISKQNFIKINNIKILFNENGYLENPQDILYLENIVGRDRLIKSLQQENFSFDNENIEQILSEYEGRIFINDNETVLIEPSQRILVESFLPKQKLDYLTVVKSYGIAKLCEVLEFGISKI